MSDVTLSERPLDDAALATITKRGPRVPRQPRFMPLPVFNRAPVPFCMAPVVRDDNFAPVLRKGQRALVDMKDKKLTYGGIYCVWIPTSREVYWLMATIERHSDGVGLRFGRGEDAAVLTLDGVIGVQYCQKRCHGRVLGIWEGAPGVLPFWMEGER
jgi:hypothetical protein